MRKLLRRLKQKEFISKATVPNPSSSEFEVNNWELSELILDKLVPVVGVHPFPLNELLLMAGTVSRFQSRLIFEWGTHIGKAARIFYEVSSALNLNTTVHSIDLPDDIEHGEHPHEQRGMLVKNIAAVKLHQGDGLETALKIMKKSKSNSDGNKVLFFVDGDHSYESVKRELAGIIKKAPKAVILLHDSFYQDLKSQYNVGPNTAIEEATKKSKRGYKRIDTKTGLPGMTLLYPS
jgi:cephalosporin hydroxylase